jgi:hypothetical protein
MQYDSSFPDPFLATDGRFQNSARHAGGRCTSGADDDSDIGSALNLNRADDTWPAVGALGALRS